MDSEKKIYVYADFLIYTNRPVGTLHVSNSKGKEFYSFEYDEKWLQERDISLDPDLELYKGRQYITDDKTIFGVFADSCPDRWGRRLLNRQEETRARANKEKPRKLQESDYLLGVFDQARMGGLRFKTDSKGEFLANDPQYSIPPWTSLRELEQASVSFEQNNNPPGKNGSGSFLPPVLPLEEHGLRLRLLLRTGPFG